MRPSRVLVVMAVLALLGGEAVLAKRQRTGSRKARHADADREPAKPTGPTFEEFDANSDGKISEAEAETTMSKNANGLTAMLGPNADKTMRSLKSEARRLFRKMDMDKDGSIGRPEYDAGIKGAMKIFMDKVTQAAMAAMMAGQGGGRKMEL
mmetsp:Transcript_3621/g.9010  ORF Transcript_3621/g.9010 Transcript_3621/m.9010 type:complete len:152 (+) Transcript_3621:98-553(+)